jgi:(p)ppGpp synthase/HD superfamily hydrolase
MSAAAFDPATFAEACAYAVTNHGDQVRKGTTVPYVSHVLAVAGLVLEHGGTTEQAVAGALHDLAEDQGGQERLDEIGLLFGAGVAGLVHALSDALPAPGEAKPPWRERKQAHLDHVDDLIARGAASVLVGACDALHNLRSIVADLDDPEVGASVFDRFNASPDDIAWRFDELIHRYARARGSLLPARLVTELVRHAGQVRRAADGVTAASAGGS